VADPDLSRLDVEGARGYAGSPVTALAPSIGGALPRGGVGAVYARPGLGKTALLVHLGLDVALRGGQVLHVSACDSVDRARAHWDEVLRAIGERQRLGNTAMRIERARTIHSFAGRTLELPLVERNLEVLRDAAQFEPTVLLLDGLLLDGLEPAAAAAAIASLRALGDRWNLCTWLSVRAGESDTGTSLAGTSLPADVLVSLVPAGRSLKLVVGTAQSAPVELPVILDPSSLLVLGEDVVSTRSEERVEPRECTLYSGGAAGAEAAFGAAAERWGLQEVNFTFDGHRQERVRGRYELSPKELSMGDVSLTYVSRRLNRAYNDKGGLIRGVLQTLWHMVSRSQQVFVVGQIQEDGTVVGGTGWSVELARMWNRDLWVYNQDQVGQDQVGWYHWDATGWSPGTPRITALHACGTGTRYLNEDGKAAIDALFERSFT
jgi:KaiC/GvpD/RAD55 family RecA-like ATPase